MRRITAASDYGTIYQTTLTERGSYETESPVLRGWGDPVGASLEASPDREDITEFKVRMIWLWTGIWRYQHQMNLGNGYLFVAREIPLL